MFLTIEVQAHAGLVTNITAHGLTEMCFLSEALWQMKNVDDSQMPNLGGLSHPTSSLLNTDAANGDRNHPL